MIFSAITIERLTSLHVRPYTLSTLAPFGAEFRRQLGPDLRGQLTVDAEDGGPEVPLHAESGLALLSSLSPHMPMYDEVMDAQGRILTLTDGDILRLTSTLVLPRDIPSQEMGQMVNSLAALVSVGPRDGGPTEQVFPTLAETILSRRPCVVTVRRAPAARHDRLVGVAADVALCLGASLLQCPQKAA